MIFSLSPLIGGFLGFIIGSIIHPLFGILGAFFGLLLGSRSIASTYNRTQDLNMAKILYHLAAADGPVNEIEARYIFQITGVRNLEELQNADPISLVQGLAANPGFSVFHRIRLVQTAFSFAQCDGPLNQTEQDFLMKLAQLLGLNFMGGQQQQQYYYRQQQQQSYTRTAGIDDYEVLGIKKEASDSAVKSAYKKLILKYHPDSLAGKGLSQSEQDNAAKTFLKIQEAYDRIKYSRGFA